MVFIGFVLVLVIMSWTLEVVAHILNDLDLRIDSDIDCVVTWFGLSFFLRFFLWLFFRFILSFFLRFI